MAIRPLLLLALAACAAAQAMGASSSFTDSATGISFQGYTDPSGFRFGLVMPSSPTTDFVAQIISPLTKGAGWGGIDFGAKMSGPMMLVAWPNGNDVIIAPYIAGGYQVDDVKAYTKGVNITPIKSGTFVNSTHVVATFVCGGCINGDSFSASEAGTSSVSMAFSSVGVTTPSDPSTQLSDHTTNGEPYGAIDFNFGQAKSSQYSTFAAMAGGSSTSSGSSSTQSGSASNGSSGSGTATNSGTSPTAAGEQASSTPAAQGAGSSSDSDDPTVIPSPPAPSAGLIVLLIGVGCVYMVQPFI
jgi:cellobiose dehydrogenase (acceptor)